MTCVVGRRQIGKTSLLAKAKENKEALYFFIAKKSEVLLCEEFIEQIKQKLQIPVFGEIKTFRVLFGFLADSWIVWKMILALSKKSNLFFRNQTAEGSNTLLKIISYVLGFILFKK